MDDIAAAAIVANALNYDIGGVDDVGAAVVFCWCFFFRRHRSMVLVSTEVRVAVAFVVLLQEGEGCYVVRIFDITVIITLFSGSGGVSSFTRLSLFTSMAVRLLGVLLLLPLVLRPIKFGL